MRLTLAQRALDPQRTRRISRALKDHNVLMHRVHILVLIFCLGVQHVAAQDPYATLRAELERIHDLDQNDRHAAGGYIGAQKDSVIAHMVRQDSLDLFRVSAIIDSAGWLGEAEVGRKANQALFLVIQHADRYKTVQARYLPVMREAVAEGKARPDELAMLEDRVRVNAGQAQLYGSQIGWKDNKPFMQPIADEAQVNERRAAVGLEPLEKYAERFGLTWSPAPKQERILFLGPAK